MIERRLHRFDNPALAGVEFPLVDVRGAADGPTLCLLAGVHGCEYSSIQAVRTLVRDLDPGELSGRVVALPFVNPASFLQRSPFVSPQDGKNPNRTFPGDRDGTFTEALTYHVFHELIEPSDYLIDLHGGDHGGGAAPVRALRRVGCRCEPPAAWRSRSASRTWSRHRAPNVSRARRSPRREMRASPGSWRRPVAAVCSSHPPSICSRVGALRAAGARDARRRSLAGPVARALATVRLALRARRGMVEARGRIPDDEVAAGQRLGAIEDLFGDERAAIEAPEDGIVLFMTSVPAVDATASSAALEPGASPPDRRAWEILCRGE